MIKKLYFDTLIVSAFVRKDLSIEELDALDYIYEEYKNGKLECCVSERVKDELDKVPEQYRDDHISVYRLFNQMTSPEERVMDIIGSGIIPFPRKDPLLDKLEGVLDVDDARHVFQSISCRCDFVTVDGSLIYSLNKWLSKNPHIPLSVLRPSQFKIQYQKIQNERSENIAQS